MNIFITGANGFIGSYLKSYFQNNASMILFTPSRLDLDLLNEREVDEFILNHKIDVIINCANIGGNRGSKNNNIVHDNLRMFFNLAKHAPNIKKIINFGSGAEYSKHKPIANVNESEANSSLPLDEYGFYKSVISKYIEKSDNIYNLRVFGAYGENENYRFRFISNAILRNLLKLPIVINQNVYFDYIYIDNLVKIVEYFIFNDVEEKIFNATTGQKIDLITLAKYVNENSDFESEIIVLNEGLNNEYTSSNKKLLSEMKHLSFTSHQDAIKKIANYFKKNLDSLDKESILNDPYLKAIDTMWEKDSK